MSPPSTKHGDSGIQLNSKTGAGCPGAFTRRLPTTNTYYSKCSVSVVDQTQSRTDIPARRGYIKLLSAIVLEPQNPGEIKRREVSWTLTQKLDTFSGPGEIKRREVALDPQVSPEEIKSRGVELDSESWTSLASVVTQRQCYGHCPCNSAPHSS